MGNMLGLQIFLRLVASLSLKVLITQGKASEKKILRTVESFRGPLPIYRVVSLRISLLSIMGELAGVGYVAVVVGT